LINVKKEILYIFVSAMLILFSGCGGGGSGSNSDNKFQYDRISIAGSSITHGDIEDISNEGEGYLGERSYVGVVERYFRENVADTIGPDELTNGNSVIDTPMSYQGKLIVYGAGEKVSGNLKASDEIAIVYGGSDVDTEIELEVDGKTYSHTIQAGNFMPVKKVFDDTNTDFYKAFRENNPQAVWVQKLDKNKEHTFTLTVKRGQLHLNFITNHMYYFQNAGVGGFEVQNFLENRSHSTVNDIIRFNPDLFILESSTNDAKTWAVELALENGTSSESQSTNEWIVENPISFTSDGKKIICSRNVTVKKGDVVIMGEYDGDIQNMVVGIVGADSSGTKVSLSKIVSYSQKRVNELKNIPQDIVNKCRIKRIKIWEDRVKEVIKRVKSGVGHPVVVGIGTCGVPNYYKPGSNPPYSGESKPYTPRRLLGYREKGEMLANENGWFFVDFFKAILPIEPGVDVDHKWTYGDNTHPNDQGRRYFGNAVIEALQSL